MIWTSIAHYLPACPIKLLFGMACPGCGLARAVLLCAQGDFLGAARMHPLAPVFLLQMLLLGLAFLLATGSASRREQLGRVVRRALQCDAVALIAVWMFRLSTGALQ